jgi:hypothetical protein
MAAENTNDTVHPDGHSSEHAAMSLIRKVNADNLQASTSAIGSVSTGKLEATASALGMTTVEGDATVTASAAPIVYSKGDTTVQQSYASAVIAGGGSFTRVRQAAAPLIIGKSMELEQVGAVAVVSGDARVRNSWVGIVVGPHVEISDDSKVLVSTRGALIIAAALLGGFGLVAIALSAGMGRVMAMRRRRAAIERLTSIPGQVTDQLRHLPEHLPDMRDISAAAERMRQRIRR